ncbi:hypothetical protein [Clostridium cochlearium]|nr:hypothetical protein [Clostridium cochlearium]
MADSNIKVRFIKFITGINQKLKKPGLQQQINLRQQKLYGR